MIIVISLPDFFVNETSIVVKLFEEGLECFHLRKPTSSEEDIRRFLCEIPQKYHRRIAIHQQYHLASEFNLRGIHCTSKNKQEFERNIHLPVKKSISVHGFSEAYLVNDLYEYAFLSPIFDSISKPGYKQGYLHEAISQFLNREHKTNFVALGGITPNNMAECCAMGFKSVALLGYIWEGDSIENFKSINKEAKRLAIS